MLNSLSQKRIKEVDDELSALSGLISQVTKFWEVVNDPLYDLDRRKRVVSEVARITGMSPSVFGMLRLLLEKGQMKYLPFIISIYHEMADEAMGRVRASVYSALEPTEEEKEKIREKLARVTGKKVILETIQDTSLIGGMVTKIKGLVLDGSLRTQLVRIRESLAKG